MPEKQAWYDLIVMPILGWLGYLHTNRVSNKRFDEYKNGHDDVHRVLCDKLDSQHETVISSLRDIQDSVSSLNDKFIEHIERHR